MPLEECQVNGVAGWRWGAAGKCYAGDGGKKRAIAQGLAEGGGKLEKFTELVLRGMHQFVGKAGGLCEKCMKSLEEGDHYDAEETQDTSAPGVEKEGRVLSGKSRQLVQAAYDALGALLQSSEKPVPHPVGKDVHEAFIQYDAALAEINLRSLWQLAVVKANEELRYTLAPMYVPDKLDAHEEYVTDDDLHKSVIDYMLQSDHRLHLQHNPELECGTVVEMVRWPYPVEVTVTKGSGETQTLTLPAGTIYTGVIWEPEYWPAVKAGKINGFSLGGSALRVTDRRTTPAEHMNPGREET